MAKTVFPDRITMSPTHEQGTNSLHKTTQITPPRHENQQQRNFDNYGDKATKADTTVLPGYVEYRIRRHVETPKERRYVVRWYR